MSILNSNRRNVLHLESLDVEALVTIMPLVQTRVWNAHASTGSANARELLIDIKQPRAAHRRIAPTGNCRKRKTKWYWHYGDCRIGESEQSAKVHFD